MSGNVTRNKSRRIWMCSFLEKNGKLGIVFLWGSLYCSVTKTSSKKTCVKPLWKPLHFETNKNIHKTFKKTYIKSTCYWQLCLYKIFIKHTSFQYSGARLYKTIQKRFLILKWIFISDCQVGWLILWYYWWWLGIYTIWTLPGNLNHGQMVRTNKMACHTPDVDMKYRWFLTTPTFFFWLHILLTTLCDSKDEIWIWTFEKGKEVKWSDFVYFHEFYLN